MIAGRLQPSTLKHMLHNPGVSARMVATHHSPEKELANAAELLDLVEIIGEFDLTRSHPQFRAVSSKRVLDLKRRARHSTLPPLRSLTAYWRIDMRRSADRLEKAVKALNAVPSVDATYPEPPRGNRLVNPADEAYNGQQDYLDAALDGMMLAGPRASPMVKVPVSP